MIPQEKQNIISRITELMYILIPKENKTNAGIFVFGDTESQNASFVVMGDARILANTIQHHMTANPLFKQFMLSVLGSYLSGNPDVEKEFLNGLLVIKNNLGMKFTN